jgi:hypothetical protein
MCAVWWLHHAELHTPISHFCKENVECHQTVGEWDNHNSNVQHTSSVQWKLGDIITFQQKRMEKECPFSIVMHESQIRNLPV